MGVVAFGLSFSTAAGAAQPNANTSVTSAYTCVDASGRKLTSDRLIAACMDREQRQIFSNGTVRVIPPSATLKERLEREAQERQAQERKREEERQRSALRAMLARYPDREALEAARLEELKVPQLHIKAAQDKLDQLAKDRKAIDQELEFYAKNPDQVPQALRRKIDAHDAAVQSQRMDIANYNSEAARINQRFDQEAKRLTPLWH